MGNPNFMEQKSNKYKILYHKFFVFLPALLIILLILMIYSSYFICYIIPLLQNWKLTKQATDYPFAFTSTSRNSKTKGIFLGISSLIFVVFLSINLLRTIFCDPGYFPSALDLEYQIVMKNLIHQQELREDSQERDETEKEKEIENENENDTTKIDIKEKEDLNNYEKDHMLENEAKKIKENDKNKEMKKNYFKINIAPNLRGSKNKKKRKAQNVKQIHLKKFITKTKIAWISTKTMLLIC